jgi:hypothetical protein
MRSLFYVLTALAVMGLAFWAYRENYRTQHAIDRVEQFNREIGRLREQLAMLNAEWAYLNRPDRLRALADINYDRLELAPLAPDQFGSIEQVAYPAPDLPAISVPVELLGRLAAAQGAEATR